MFFYILFLVLYRFLHKRMLFVFILCCFLRWQQWAIIHVPSKCHW